MIIKAKAPFPIFDKSGREISPHEYDLLMALAWMCEQHLGGGGELDHLYISAGEMAVERLIEFGLVMPSERGGTWTTAGRAVLDSH